MFLGVITCDMGVASISPDLSRNLKNDLSVEIFLLILLAVLSCSFNKASQLRMML